MVILYRRSNYPFLYLYEQILTRIIRPPSPFPSGQPSIPKQISSPRTALSQSAGYQAVKHRITEMPSNRSRMGPGIVWGSSKYMLTTIPGRQVNN